MAQLNFNLLISQAKEIDTEIIYLKDKVMEPSKFGLGREDAVGALKSLDKKIVLIKNQCSQELKTTNEEYECIKSDIKNVKYYLKNLGDNLDKIEAEAISYGYRTFECHCSNKRNIPVSPNMSGVTELSMADSQFLTPIFPSKKRYEGLKLYSTDIEHDFHSSTPQKNSF